MADLFFFQSHTIHVISMYGIFTYIWLIFMVNVGKYRYHTWMVWECLSRKKMVHEDSRKSHESSRFFSLHLGVPDGDGLKHMWRKGSVWKPSSWAAFRVGYPSDKWYVPWSKVAILGVVIPPLIGILIMGPYKPLLLGWWPSPIIWK